MRIDAVKLRKIARSQGLSLNALLIKSKVSKTAFYHLLRKESILPASLRSMADALAVRPGLFLTEKNLHIEKIRRVLAMTDRIVAADRRIDPENVRLTLLLLEEAPLQRLRRSLVRGRAFDIHN